MLVEQPKRAFCLLCQEQEKMRMCLQYLQGKGLNPSVVLSVIGNTVRVKQIRKINMLREEKTVEKLCDPNSQSDFVHLRHGT